MMNMGHRCIQLAEKCSRPKNNRQTNIQKSSQHNKYSTTRKRHDRWAVVLLKPGLLRNPKQQDRSHFANS